MRSLATSRLRWRSLRDGDEAILQALGLDDHIRRYLLDGATVPANWAQSELARSKSLEADGGIGLGLIHEAGCEEPIGFAGFRVYEEHHAEPQIVFALRQPFTGRGFATEIVRSLIELERTRGGDRIHAAVDEPNRASIRVLEKLGFVRWNAWPGAFGLTAGFVLGAKVQLTVARLWNGGEALLDERANVSLRFDLDRVVVDLDAPHHGDPPPASPIGPTDRLWEHEVVEVFLLGDDDRYVEVELGPHGHQLVLVLCGYRRVERKGMEIDYHVKREGGRWKARAVLPSRWMPSGLRRVNAYAIHGVAGQRRYLASFPSDAPAPDFHRLDDFGSLADALRRQLLV